MSLHLLSQSTDLPLELAEVKVHLRETGTDQDALIMSMIAAATEECEGILHRSIMPAIWLWKADAFPACNIVIPAPVSNILTFKYFDETLTEQTLVEATDWVADVADDYQAIVFPAYGQAWPTAGTRPGAVRIEFESGWVDADAVPKVIKTWLLLRVGAYFMNRESWTHSQPIQRNQHIDRMLDRWEVPVV